ncbi:MAG: extradiol ring-cleavage dioxygenase [Jatrophihabitans sp.]|nr:MAG: extradiol ring-cleavage dioxygenase [Jatrophihabitans sp.]
MTEPIARLRSLRSVQLRTVELANSVDFYTEVWGLRVVEREADAAWLRGTGENHHVLSLVDAPQNGLGCLSFAVATPTEVDVAARNLEARGIPLLEGPGRSGRPGAGYGLRFCDPEGRTVEVIAEMHAVAPLTLDESSPIGVTHVVLNTADIDAAARFYCEVLGLRVSDWSEHQMAFLRCNSYHHCIAFNQAEWASLNHVAYEMPSVDHFMRGIGRLRHYGRTPLWGPGRHGPGNNTFSYFADPARLVCEYTSDVAQIVEADWLPRVWRRVPELADLWGTAGPPSGEARACMAGYADPGAFADQPHLAELHRTLAGEPH